MKKTNTTIRYNQRPGQKKLTRYIHSRNYSKLSGYKGMPFILHIRRNRLIMAFIAMIIIAIGLWFVFI